MRFRYISALPFEQRPLGIVAEEVETMDAKRKQDDCQKPVEILASKMEALGYVADWSVVNALDFGLPQSRARCWMVFLKVHDHHLGTQDQRRRDANNVIADAKSMQLDQYEPWEEVFAGVAKAWPERITPAVSMDDPKGTELVDKNVRTKAKTRWPDRRALTSGCARVCWRRAWHQEWLVRVVAVGCLSPLPPISVSVWMALPDHHAYQIHAHTYDIARAVIIARAEFMSATSSKRPCALRTCTAVQTSGCQESTQPARQMQCFSRWRERSGMPG